MYADSLPQRVFDAKAQEMSKQTAKPYQIQV